MIYVFVRSTLGPDMTEPCGAIRSSSPSHGRYAYCLHNTNCERKHHIQFLQSKNSKLHIVVANITFGMGWIAQMFVLSFTGVLQET